MHRFAACLAVVSASIVVAAAARAADSDVRLNSIGYLAPLHKVATVSASATNFILHRAGDDAVATMGAVTGPFTDTDTGASVYYADFSAVTDTGRYYLEVPGVGRSAEFAIASEVYRDAFGAVMMGFYGWRCGTAVSFTFAGTTYAHGPCHTHDGLLSYIAATDAGIADGMRDGTKGWHDAGDYGKYTVNGAFAAGMMLRAF
jgi:endoglucanase